MESSRPKEERKTKEHITPGNGNRHEKNEQELDGRSRIEWVGECWSAAYAVLGVTGDCNRSVAYSYMWIIHANRLDTAIRHKQVHPPNESQKEGNVPPGSHITLVVRCW
ncbi:unnamed protein product [Schistosoma margrebowiei]|uniref:Uncharacterized protein n=1 Tax=Schistosoma margrebowiei TaxID=48269 RepID=A0A183LAE0_9TREM|nr:unnamed protein product [Schistosoma margrebowiei]